MTRILLILAVSLLGACSTYRPVPTDAEHKSFRSYVTEQMIEDGKTTYEIPHAAKALSKYVSASLLALRERASRSWNNSDLTTAGGVGAVIGGVADKTGLLNMGLFTAGVGITASTRYKLEQQIDLTLSQFSRLTCMQGRVGMLTPEMLRLVRTSGDQGAIEAMFSAPEDIIRNAEHVQNAHLVALYALKPTAPTKAELTGYFERYKSVEAAATSAGVMLRAAKVSAETEAATKLMRVFAVELEACGKLS